MGHLYVEPRRAGAVPVIRGDCCGGTQPPSGLSLPEDEDAKVDGAVGVCEEHKVVIIRRWWLYRSIPGLEKFREKEGVCVRVDDVRGRVDDAEEDEENRSGSIRGELPEAFLGGVEVKVLAPESKARGTKCVAP